MGFIRGRCENYAGQGGYQKALEPNVRDEFHPFLLQPHPYFVVLMSIYDSIKAYFGDLKDGVHHGDENDPRVSVIEVVPKEIRYWLATEGSMRQALSTAVDAALGKTSVPGELRTITEPEVSTIFVSFA